MIENITKGLWAVPGRVKLMPAFYLPCRMTIVRLRDGRLLLHSPVELDEGTVEAIGELGEVGYLVAPNKVHHLFLEAAIESFPDAAVVGAPGLADKRDDLAFDGVLGDAEPAWSDELTPRLIEGAAEWNEVVFFHHATGTLICADLVFNLQEFEGWLTPWMCRMFGTYKRIAHSKLWRSKYDDVAAFAASVRTVLEWPIERIVMAHGDMVEQDCDARLADAFSWLLAQDVSHPPS